MTAFAAQEAAQARLQAKQRQEPDEDGFVTVTRGGRTGPARQDVAQEQAEKQKQKQKGLEDFYRFQTREKRKARAGELVRKFEEDKEKVKRMRERRGWFKVRFDAVHF
jgi:ribosomal RNA-processing protein 7